jgi:hypothetical protein
MSGTITISKKFMRTGWFCADLTTSEAEGRPRVTRAKTDQERTVCAKLPPRKEEGDGRCEEDDEDGDAACIRGAAFYG